MTHLMHERDLPLLRYVVEAGRPRLNRRDALGTNLLSSLVFWQCPDLPSWRTWWGERGLDVVVVLPSGHTAIAAACNQRMPALAAWLEGQRDQRDQRVSGGPSRPV